MLEIASKSIPTQNATAPCHSWPAIWPWSLHRRRGTWKLFLCRWLLLRRVRLSFSRSPLPCEDHVYDQGPNITRHEHRDIECERGAEFNPPNPQNELRGHDPDHGIDCSFAVQELASGHAVHCWL
jgi:hypothetical protein